MRKKELIITIVVAIVVIGIAIFYNMSKPKAVEYFLATSKSSEENKFIEEYRILKKMYKDKSLKEMTSYKTFNKYDVSEYFNEEYFSDKKVAVVVLYEDDSKGYIYSIDEVIYNEARTEATIKYTYRDDGYAGPLNNAWYNYLFVEVDGTVENVNFVKENKVVE